MTDLSAQMLSVLVEMRDLLRLVAEPAIAQRDKKLRGALRAIAGSVTGKKAKAILLMDGTRTQAGIVNECGITKGNMSVLVKNLKSTGLLTGDSRQPKLALSIPSTFFEQQGESDE
ncbi:MarR family transcriptional regulator [Rhodopseudomonas palustris]|uniref:Uncharacterized protein n=1 Tax=Rhodopseudomonas palustris (strain BisB18) TaxID=316056 RepID=Q21AP1_RHOPB